MRNSKVNMVEAGKRLRELRGIKTRTGVSRETGIPLSSLEAYEWATREPSAHVKQKLADYYGVPVSEIFLPLTTTKSN